MARTTISTPIGPFSIVAQGRAVLASGFTADTEALVALIHPDLRDEADADADMDLMLAATYRYLDGDLTAIDGVEVEQSSGPFIGHAWKVLRDVQAGDPVTYTELAIRAGRPSAIRGAAQACARNAAALFVPCHRVIRTDGTLGGYRWGLDVKTWLIAHEQATNDSIAITA